MGAVFGEEEGMAKRKSSKPYTTREMPELTAREFVQQEPLSLVVAKGETVTLSPTNPELAHHFARVPMRTVEDLQVMGFLPRGLDIESLRTAVRDDDDFTRRDMEAWLERNPKAAKTVDEPCDCGASKARERTPQATMAQLFRLERKRVHPALSALLSEHYNNAIAPDDVVSRTTWRWVKYVERRLIPIYVLFPVLFQDITISADATLVAEHGTSSMLARDIYIHQTGTLRSLSSHLRIWASSIQTFDGPSLSISVLLKAPPWVVLPT